MTSLKEERISGQILDVITPKTTGMQANIWSDTAGDLISTNGRHRAILSEGMVYDNIRQNGISYDDWVKDLHSPGGSEIKTTDF